MHRNVLVGMLCAGLLLLANGHLLANGDDYGIGPGGGQSQYAWARATVPAAADEDDGPTVADANSVCWFTWVPTYTQIEAHAYGEVVADNQGLNKAWCRVTHRDTTNEFGGGLACGADVETFTPFTFTSGILDPGAVVNVELDVAVDGTLRANEGGTADGMVTQSHVSTLIGIIRKSDDMTVLEVEGEAYWESTYHDAGGVTYALDAVDMLENACTIDGDTVTVAYQDTLAFQAEVDAEYWFYFDLATGVSCSGWADGYAGPLTTLAVADFYNTSTYELTATTGGADFEVLPEPATLALLGLGALATLRRRRR